MHDAPSRVRGPVAARARALAAALIACRLLVLAACLVGVLACAGPAVAAPGLAQLGGPSIGLATDTQYVGAIVMHRGNAYAAVTDAGGNGRFLLHVQQFDRTREAWQPVGNFLNAVLTDVDHVQLLSTRQGELYVAWIEKPLGGDERPVAVVARMRPDGRGWDRVMEQPASGEGDIELAQAGDTVWIGWQLDGPRFAWIRGNTINLTRPHLLLGDIQLRGLVGYGDAAYAAYTESIYQNAHDGPDGEHVAAGWTLRVRVARLVAVADPVGVRRDVVEGWDVPSPPPGADRVFLTAGSPAAAARPVLGWDVTDGPGRDAVPRIELMRLRADGTGFDRVPIAPLVALRGIRRLRGLTATARGIAIAAEHVDERSENLRLYTIGGDAIEPTITAGDRLPDAVNDAVVTMAPEPAPAAPGALVLGYRVRSRWGLPRAAAMRYSP